MEVTQGHNGNTGPYKCIVRIIPLGSLGVHPDTRIGDEVGYFGEQRDQDLFGKIDLVDLTARRGHQTTIRPHRLNTAIDDAIQILVKLDSVVGSLRMLAYDLMRYGTLA